jgi:hypothetical protein
MQACQERGEKLCLGDAEGNLRARLEGMPEILPLELAELLFLFEDSGSMPTFAPWERM